jgi:hypothetical protein
MHCKTDSEIEQWVLKELTKSLLPKEVCILSYDGVVRLTGTVQSYRDKQAVEEAARRASGVVDVLNALRVASPKLIPERLTSAPHMVGRQPLVHQTTP